MTVGGCGAKLDPRDFGKNGKIDREIYWIRVPEKDAEAILARLAEEGIVPEVDETVNLSAPERAQRRLKKLDMTTLIAMAALIQYVISAMFGVPMFYTSIYFFFMLAFAAGRSKDDPLREER